MTEPSSRQKRLIRGVVLLLVALVLIALAGYLTWPGGASPRRAEKTSPPACDYASGDWMQQPGCERPPTR